MKSAVLRQFQWERLNPLEQYKDFLTPSLLVGRACDVKTIGASDQIGFPVRIMQSRTVGWHTDGYATTADTLVLLQVISGDDFKVQGRDKKLTTQPAGTVILLDQSLSHRLLAPSPRLKSTWTAQYLELPRTIAEILTDEELANCLKV